MDIEIRKLNLIQWLIKVDNPAVINQIERLKEETEKSKDWRDDLSDNQKKSVEVFLEQIKNGQFIPHEEAMDEIKTHYKV